MRRIRWQQILHPAVVGRKRSAFSNGQVEQQGVGDLLVSDEPLSNLRQNPDETGIQGPEVVVSGGCVRFQYAKCLSDPNLPAPCAGVTGKAHEGRLRQRAGCPALVPPGCEPTVRCAVVYMSRPSQRHQNIHIQERGHPPSFCWHGKVAQQFLVISLERRRHVVGTKLRP